MIHSTGSRGGDAVRIITLSPDLVAGGVHTIGQLERLSEALDELATRDSALAELVDLHFFCGYTSIAA